ncbi:histidine phosphatase family protein [Suicoccus acidiformans]|uniref:Histidine phosphatase family protein n=1 Tax=Suicoccus acidiformans TaxID=2036206 RepID=A0A347WKN5_9LACT|nr:histidine phosphatase family protein [Suicoccus acidiformans]AXY25642.1 histidine phosphatase family protein [Suicoccus acidiformans]
MSKGVTFYFVRHGETYFNQYFRMQGWSNAPLTEKGIRDVHRSGRGLAEVEFDAVYTSDLQRTVDTAEILLEENHHAFGLHIEKMYEFREVFFGTLEGLPSKDVWPNVMDSVKIMYDLPAGTDAEVAQTMNAIKKADPEGDAENYLEFWTRVEPGILKLLERHKATDENILVVSHGMTIRYILDGLLPDFEESEPLQNASVTRISYRDGQFELLDYNKTDHFTD